MSEIEANKRALAGRTAIVTGASRGIGAAIALALAKQGADLAITATKADRLERVKENIEAESVRCLARCAEASDPGVMESFIEQVGQTLKPPDILINNVGIYLTAPIAAQQLDTWRLVLETNLTSAMWASKHVLLGMMKQKWGRIVNISSISGQMGEAYGAAYSASKFGMIGLTQSLALESAREGITVNAVCPGWVSTDMALEQLSDPIWCKLNQIPTEQSLEIARLSVPTQRFIEPAEVAALVCFLCSDDARSITGQAINICGGLTLH